MSASAEPTADQCRALAMKAEQLAAQHAKSASRYSSLQGVYNFFVVAVVVTFNVRILIFSFNISTFVGVGATLVAALADTIGVFFTIKQKFLDFRKLILSHE